MPSGSAKFAIRPYGSLRIGGEFSVTMSKRLAVTESPLRFVFTEVWHRPIRRVVAIEINR